VRAVPMVAKVLVLSLACAPAARAESGEGFLAGTITIIEAIFAGISSGSSGMASSGAGIRQAGRIAGGIELGIVALAFAGDPKGARHYLATNGTIVALGTYNLAAVGSGPWRFAINEIGLHAVFVTEYLDFRRNEGDKHEAPRARLAPMPGGLALLGRF